jgi:hypothetical protein
MTEGPVGAADTAPRNDLIAAAAADEPIADDARRPSTAAAALAVGILAAIGFVLPVLISRAYGALGIVRNDDWSYLRTLFTWIQTGHLDFNNWVSMTLLMQLVFAAPIVLLFGHNITLIQLETATMGVAGLGLVAWVGFVVTRRLWVATFIGVMVAVGPLWGALTVSYMTDVPAFAVSMLACALGVRALRPRTVSMPYLVASMSAGLVAFTIRQYAAVPPIAVALIGGYLLLREGSRPRIRIFLIACATILLGALVFWLYWRTIPDPKLYSPHVPSGHSIKATLYKGTGLVRLLGLLVSPAIVVAGPLRILRRAWGVARDTTVFVILGVAALFVFTAWAGPNIGFAGNYITPWGILAQGVVAGHRPAILPPGMFVALLTIGSIAVVFLALAILPILHAPAQRWRARDLTIPDPVAMFLGVVVGGYGIAYFAAAITDIPLYDRYVLPAVPLVAILLLRPTVDAPDAPDASAVASTRRPARGLVARSLAALVALAFVGTVYTVDSASFDGTRWQVAVDATHAGWSRPQIRGGFEWANYYAGTRVAKGARYCVVVMLNPTGGLHNPRIVSYGYYHSPFIDPVLVAALRTKTLCRPALPPQDR